LGDQLLLEQGLFPLVFDLGIFQRCHCLIQRCFRPFHVEGIIDVVNLASTAPLATGEPRQPSPPDDTVDFAADQSLFKRIQGSGRRKYGRCSRSSAEAVCTFTLRSVAARSPPSLHARAQTARLPRAADYGSPYLSHDRESIGSSVVLPLVRQVNRPEKAPGRTFHFDNRHKIVVPGGTQLPFCGNEQIVCIKDIQTVCQANSNCRDTAV
jgi:hypothetical protein